MAWNKSTDADVTRFDRLAAVEGAERRILFGCPVYLLDGVRYATLYQGRVGCACRPRTSRRWSRSGGVPFEPHAGRAPRTGWSSRTPSTTMRSAAGSPGRSPTDDAGALYRQEHARVLSSVLARVDDFPLAEECVQDAFVAAAERWLGAPPPNPRAWLIRVAWNKAMDRLRRQARFPELRRSPPPSPTSSPTSACG